MVLPNEYAGYYPEEEETIIDIAKPNDSGAMPAPNYQIAGPLADHKPNTAMKDAMASAGANVAGNVGQAGLMGGGPEGTFFEKGLFGDFQFPWAAGAGSAAFNPAAAGAGHSLLAGPGAAAAGNLAGATGASAAGAGAAGAGTMAALASNPIGWAVGLGMLGKGLGWFNKGGGVGPLSPQYAGEGMYTFPIGHGAGAWDGYRGPDYEDFLDWDGYRGGDYEDDVIDIEPIEGVPFNKGGNVQHKEHGGMTGPLSNNKSVKIEKKETIEYKN